MDIISKILDYLKKRHKLVRNVITVSLLVVVVFWAFQAAKYEKLYQTEVKAVHMASLSNAALTSQNQALKDDLANKNAQVTELGSQVEDLKEEVELKEAENATLLENAACSVSFPDPMYFQSTFVWNYLKNEIGLNDYVAAGILGNIMTEVGGGSLDISYYSCKESLSGKYYGMCQWSGSRKERLFNEFGRSLEDQCKFLHVELFEVIPEDSSFYSLQDEREAALYFAKTYERCAEWSYERRQNSATQALVYFTGSEK